MSTEILSPEQVQRAAELIKAGRLVAFPTETVYGLGASIFDPEAIQALFQAKGRPSDNPLIAHVHSVSQVEEIAQEIPDDFYLLARQFFPGPLSVVLKKRACIPMIASGGLDSIAVRMPSHPIALALIASVGAPLVAPSANLSGKPSSTTLKHVLEDFDGKIAAVIDGGQTDVGIESTVISLLGPIPVLLRPGSVTKEAIEEVLGVTLQVVSSSSSGSVLSPGMKYRHYAPRTPIRVFYALEDLSNHLQSNSCIPKVIQKLVPRLCQSPGVEIPASGSIFENIGPTCENSTAGAFTKPRNQFLSHFGYMAKRMLLSRLPLNLSGLDHFVFSRKEFYALLRHADEKRYDEILILCDEEDQKDAGLMNRLSKAASK